MKVYVLMEWEGNSTEVDGGTARAVFLDKDQAEAKALELIAIAYTKHTTFGLHPESQYEVQETELQGVLDGR